MQPMPSTVLLILNICNLMYCLKIWSKRMCLYKAWEIPTTQAVNLALARIAIFLGLVNCVEFFAYNAFCFLLFTQR